MYLDDVLRNLSFRGMSKPKDAILATAPLLGVPILPLLKEKDYEKRVEIFW
jgi:hypothetical protein